MRAGPVYRNSLRRDCFLAKKYLCKSIIDLHI
jgi:hypothetical protein